MTAEQKSSNEASGHAQVGMQIGFLTGDVNPVRHAAADDIARDLTARIEELRDAVRAALERAELSAEDAATADYELAAAADLVPDAARGDRRELMDRLRRVGEVLQKGLKVLAQLADVVATVKGMT